MTGDYLRTDEVADILSSLHLAHRALLEVNNDPLNWKWVVIGLHCGLQTAMVCQLSGSANLGALANEGKKYNGWFAWLLNSNRTEPAPERPFLADAKVLFKRMKDTSKRIETAGGVVAVTEYEEAAFGRLHDYRNDFMHCKPKSWSIEIGHLGPMVNNVIAIIARILADGYALRQATDSQRAEAGRLITDMKVATSARK